MLIKQIAAYTKFTTTEQTIAEYILANTSSMENISIQELAKRTFTSNASIIRFAQKMGFRGFKEFKIQLLKSIEQLDGPQKDINPNIPFEDHSPLMKISEYMMH